MRTLVFKGNTVEPIDESYTSSFIDSITSFKGSPAVNSALSRCTWNGTRYSYTPSNDYKEMRASLLTKTIKKQVN